MKNVVFWDVVLCTSTANIQVDTNTVPFTISAIYSTARYVISAEEYMAYFQLLGPKFLTGGD
jgi:hypothetical protein